MRPILPSDKRRLLKGFARLSEQSRQRRFLTSLDHLSERQLRYLTEIDYSDHMAWVALDASHPAQPGMGVARYVRLAEDPDTAEAAVTVVDEYQGRGIGTILLAELAHSARQHGIRRFRAYVLPDNVPMIEMLHGLGATATLEGSLLCVDVPIPANADELADTPTGRVFRSVAKREFPPLLFRRLGAPERASDPRPI